MPSPHHPKALISALILTTSSAGQAQPPDVIRGYLKPIITKIAADPNVGGWTWKTNGHGGYLLRRFADVTGDGVPELFLSSSLLADKRHSEWTVFHASSDGKYIPYTDSLLLPHSWEISNRATSELFYIGRQDDEKAKIDDPNSYPLHRFEFDFPKIKENISYITEEETSTWRKIGNYQKLPNIESILLADYVNDPSQEWPIEKEWIVDAHDSLFQPRNQEKATKNTTFTPEAALTRLGLASPGTSGEGHGTQTQKKPVSAPSTTPASRLDKPVAAEGPNNGKAVSPVKWIALPVAVMALAVLVLLWEKLRGGHSS